MTYCMISMLLILVGAMRYQFQDKTEIKPIFAQTQCLGSMQTYNRSTIRYTLFILSIRQIIINS